MRLAKERRYNDLHKDFRGKFLKEIRQSFLSASARKVSRRACTEVQVTQFGRSQSQPDEGACQNFGTATSHCAHNGFSSFFFNNAEVLKCRNDFLLISFYLCARVIHIWG